MTTRIIGTGSYVPENRITNEDLSKLVETSDEWIQSRTGIRERRLVREDTTSGMAAKAALMAIRQAGIKPEEIELILLATSSSDFCYPNGASQVQAALKAVNAAAYDISAACTGFEFALNTAHAFLSAGMYKTVLVIGADTLSKLVDWSDRGTCVLFGDGAGAVVVRTDEHGIIGMNMYTDGAKGGVLSCVARSNGNFLLGTSPRMGFTVMDGQEVFRFAVKRVPQCIEKLLEDTHTSRDEVDWYIIHQANRRIIESIAKRMKLPFDRFPVNMEKYGNTSAASIPLLLDEMNRDGRLKRGQKIVLAGFGAGLTWGSALLEW